MASITLKNFSFSYELAQKESLKDINFSFDSGKVYGIIGSNGAGKSTLLHAIRGFIPKYYPGSYTGDILIGDQSVFHMSSSELAHQIGFVFQNPFTQISGVKATVYEEVAYGLENLGLAKEEIKIRVDKILKETGLSELAKRHPYQLSGGQQQRVALASVLVMDQDIFLIDEPTSQLDPESSQHILETIAQLKEKGKTILLVEHELDFLAQLADELLVLVDGQVIEHGSSSTVFSDSHLLRYGISVPKIVRFKEKLQKKAIYLSPKLLSAESVASQLLQVKKDGQLKKTSQFHKMDKGLSKDLQVKAPTTKVPTTEAPIRDENSFSNISSKETLLDIRQVSYSYPNGQKAVKDISFTIHSGQRLAIIGQNGAGKTTTVKLLNGLIRPDSGQVLYRGIDTKDMTTAQLTHHVGYVFQNPDDQLFNASVYDELAYSLKKLAHHQKEIDDIDRQVHYFANVCGIEDYLGHNPYDLPLSTRKLVAIAAILTLDPEVVILDEVNAGQDFKGMCQIQDIINLLSQKGKAVITITHDMEFVAECMDQLLVLMDGRIGQASTPLDIFCQKTLLKQAHLHPPLSIEISQALGLSPKTLEIDGLADQVASYLSTN